MKGSYEVVVKNRRIQYKLGYKMKFINKQILFIIIFSLLSSSFITAQEATS